MLTAKSYAGREPVNDYEELCKMIASASAGLPTGNEQRQLVLTWLESADPDSVRDTFAEALEHITAREQAELLHNVVMRTDQGRFAERVSGALEVALIPRFLNDITAWRDNTK